MEPSLVPFLVLAGFVPFAAGMFFLVRHLRREQVKDWMRLWRQGEGPMEHRGMVAPDGKTLIELEKLRNADRDKARAMYERLTAQKLDVLKTGVAMGYREADLSGLDARLEKIIGSEKLASLLGDELPSKDLAAAPQAMPGIKESSGQLQ